MAFAAVVFLIISSVLAHIDVDDQRILDSRLKREASGALHIVTNHAQPIHADVKSETTNDNIEKAVSEPVTPPEDTVTTYEQKSLRRFFAPPSTLALIRSISRVVTLIVLFVSAVLESYPTFHNLINIIISFVNAQ